MSFYAVDRHEWKEDRSFLYICLIFRIISISKILPYLKSAGSAEHNVYDSDITDSINHPLPYCEASPETNDKCSSPYDKFSKVVRAASGP